MNDAKEREELKLIGDECTIPWILAGDFNSPLHF